MSDRIFGGIGLVLAIIYAWAAAGIQESFLTDEVGPKVFPWIIATILGLSSAWFLIKPDPDPEWPTWGRVAEIGLDLYITHLQDQDKAGEFPKGEQLENLNAVMGVVMVSGVFFVVVNLVIDILVGIVDPR